MTFTVRLSLLIAFLAALCLNGEQLVVAQGKKKGPANASGAEDDYYKMIRYDIPQGEVVEPGAIELMPDGKLAVATRRGGTDGEPTTTRAAAATPAAASSVAVSSCDRRSAVAKFVWTCAVLKSTNAAPMPALTALRAVVRLGGETRRGT